MLPDRPAPTNLPLHPMPRTKLALTMPLRLWQAFEAYRQARRSWLAAGGCVLEIGTIPSYDAAELRGGVARSGVKKEPYMFETAHHVSFAGGRAVYRVWRRHEAMKIPLRDRGDDRELAGRFNRAIEIYRLLAQHSHIVVLYDALFHYNNQLLMFFLEAVEGRSVERIIERELAIREAIAFTRQVLDALRQVHSMGVVHRDVKPSNIMVAPAGTVTLVDFGIARMRAEIVTGKKPFGQGSAFSIMAAHMQQNPAPPREVEPTLSESILQAIAKNPSSRFQALEEFMLALASSRTVLSAAPARGFRPYYCGPQRIRRSSPSEIVGLRREPSRGPGKWHSPRNRTTTVLLRAFDSDRSGSSGTSILETSLKMSRGVTFAWTGRHRRKRSPSVQADTGWIPELGSSRRNAVPLPP